MISLICSNYLSCDSENKRSVYITPAALVYSYCLLVRFVLPLLLLLLFYWNSRQTACFLKVGVNLRLSRPADLSAHFAHTLTIPFVKAKKYEDIYVTLFAVSAFQQFVGLLTEKGLKWSYEEEEGHFVPKRKLHGLIIQEV